MTVLTAVAGTSSKELDSLISAQPRTKEDFIKLSDDIITYIIKRHQDKPLYATFVEHHVRELAAPLRDVEVRKAASGLTTLANEKQKEQRDKASGKKKGKGASKPGLGGAKVASRCVHCFINNKTLCTHIIIGWIRLHTTRPSTTLAATQMTSCRFYRLERLSM